VLNRKSVLDAWMAPHDHSPDTPAEPMSRKAKSGRFACRYV
jgi:hypothetical protein